jgi:hypothetical protein
MSHALELINDKIDILTLERVSLVYVLRAMEEYLEELKEQKQKLEKELCDDNDSAE